MGRWIVILLAIAVMVIAGTLFIRTHPAVADQLGRMFYQLMG
jgi:hypothetical protein